MVNYPEWYHLINYKFASNVGSTMEKIKTILVPMDGSKNSFKALTKAIFLAKKCDSSITALYVLHTAFDNPNLIYVPQTQNELKK